MGCRDRAGAAGGGAGSGEGSARERRLVGTAAGATGQSGADQLPPGSRQVLRPFLPAIHSFIHSCEDSCVERREKEMVPWPRGSGAGNLVGKPTHLEGPLPLVQPSHKL